MSTDKLAQEVALELQKSRLDLVVPVTMNDLKISLSALLNDLIANDFFRLISLLYSLDISEKKLRSLLRPAGNITAGEVIAQLIIERQLQKIEARKAFVRDDNIAEEDRW